MTMITPVLYSNQAKVAATDDGGVGRGHTFRAQSIFVSAVWGVFHSLDRVFAIYNNHKHWIMVKISLGFTSSFICLYNIMS